MAQAIDPVCGMSVDTKTTKFKSEYDGMIYYFCAPGCKKSFDRAPEKYTGENEAAPAEQEGQQS
jgi:YHS domain-containing protein